MKVELNENQLQLIINCLEKQKQEFTGDDFVIYENILHSIKVANDSINYDF